MPDLQRRHNDFSGLLDRFSLNENSLRTQLDFLNFFQARFYFLKFYVIIIYIYFYKINKSIHR